ncbi:MAG: aldehyde dehydrogenase family protein [Aliivibrio sp.]|uniref:aldehyde dehydrogenase family protein n=1 Tax=Aliivibrio sp. TaxID=1872443 RepID=UPI001A619775|nr:aldehyde dehydrogenase family protein [Aliivibrio sp.]
MSDVLTSRSPIDGSIYATRKLASPLEVETAVQEAQSAHLQWKSILIKDRATICHQMIDAIISNQDEIARQLCWMMGRPIRFARAEIMATEERARYLIDAAEEALEPIVLNHLTGYTRYIKKEPLGTVVVISPWNYPYLSAINILIPAIMAGNCVILKHSSQTLLCAEQFAKAFQQTQLPLGVFQYLHLSRTATQKLAQHPGINYVSFTGSVEGGKAIKAATSNRIVTVGLDLGGKDSAYIRHDANLEHAVESCIDGAYFNSGQSCSAIERIYVHHSIYSEFVDKAEKLIKQFKLGPPFDPQVTLGPVVSFAAAKCIRSQINEAIKMGAVAHISTDDFPNYDKKSCYLAPQLLTNVNHKMKIMRDETFGPVVGVMRVKTDQEAIELMNDSQYGLTASVFATDINAAIAIGEELHVGTFFINRCDYQDPALAWSGTKNSGSGSNLSTFGYHNVTQTKSFNLKTHL